MSKSTPSQRPVKTMVPFGFCQCGCGELAPIVPHTDTSRGRVKGQPSAFKRNHNMRLFTKSPDEFWGCFTRGAAPAHRPELGPCLEWQGVRTKRNYGVTKYQGARYQTHRLAYALANGPIPEGASVMHRCDNPPCGEPSHLVCGSNLDNVQDRNVKGRTAQGQKAGGAKLNVAAVQRIRSRHAAGESQVAIAQAYGITTGTVFAIVHRLSWKHVA
jgi:HNH endonuclease